MAKVVFAYILQAVVNGRFYIQSIRSRVLGSDEQVPSRESALPHGSSSLFLVSVRLSGVCERIVPVSVHVRCVARGSER